MQFQTALARPEPRRGPDAFVQIVESCDRIRSTIAIFIDLCTSQSLHANRRGFSKTNIDRTVLYEKETEADANNSVLQS